MGIAELLLVGVSFGVSIPLIFVLFMSTKAPYIKSDEDRS